MSAASYLLLARGSGRGKAQASGVQPFFEDTFAGGQLNPTSDFVYSNDEGAINGFTVVASGATGAVVQDGYTHSLQGTYIAKPLGEPNGSPQLNFSWTTELDELWFEWVVHFPSTYVHRNNYTPPSTPLVDNNKFWIFWGGAYSMGSVQVGCELLTDGTGGTGTSNGKSYSRPLARRSTDGLYIEIAGIGNNVVIGSGAPCVPGTWNTIRGYMKKESSLGAADGAYTQWINGVRTEHATGVRIGASDPAKVATGFHRGYFLGFANSGFTDDTVIHTQRIAFYDTDPGWA